VYEPTLYTFNGGIIGTKCREMKTGATITAGKKGRKGDAVIAKRDT